MKELTVVIVSFNTKEYLDGTLRSLEKILQKDWNVVVVDNGSTDGSPALVRQKFPFVTLIESKKNLGFAAANNLALCAVSTPYVWLLNSDTAVFPDAAIGSVLEYFANHPDVGIVTPKVVLENGALDQSCHRGFPTPWNALAYFVGLERVFSHVPLLNRVFCGYHQTWKGISTTHEIDACSGAAMFVRTEAMRKVGLLDALFFMYGEDLDWCYRFRTQGWKVMFFPSVEVTHYKHKSGIGRDSSTQYGPEMKKQAQSHFFDTMIQFYEKHHAASYPAWFVHVIRFGVRIINLMKGVTHGH